MAVALVLGLGLALARVARHAWARVPAVLFGELIRGSPLLLQLFYIYYVFPLAGVRLAPIEAGLLGLGINYGAYLSEGVRAGVVAVQKGQGGAGRAPGLTRWPIMRPRVLPQAVRIVIPPLGNYFVSLFKDTALVSTISIAELMFRGHLIAADTFKYMRIYSVVFVIYVLISAPASLGVRWLERRLQSDRPVQRGKD